MKKWLLILIPTIQLHAQIRPVYMLKDPVVIVDFGSGEAGAGRPGGVRVGRLSQAAPHPI